MAEKKWPEATNAEEAARLRLVYKEMTDAVGVPGELTNGDMSPDDWRWEVFRQREREHLLLLANMHATLAVADEIQAFRARYRYGGGVMGHGGLVP